VVEVVGIVNIIKKEYLMIILLKTPEFKGWFNKESKKSKFQIDARLSRIVVDEYFGDHKYLEGDLWELRWANGRRIYYAHLSDNTIVVLLLGGNKNGQKKDITKARNVLRKNAE
jgi:putative addiction module killer protein